jgi:hypothetical protein
MSTTVAAPAEDHLLFWNKLGSLEELHNSEVGANLIVEGNIGFLPAIDGNGFFSTGHWYIGNRIIIPANGLQLSPQKGTIAAWVMYPQNPIVKAYGYSMFSLLDGVYQSGPGRDNTLGQQVVTFIGDGTTGHLYTFYVHLNFGNKVSILIPNIDQVFKPSEFHYVTIVWDKNGIEGSDEKIRVFIDTVLIGKSNNNNWGNELDLGNRHTIGKGEGFNDGRPAFVIDELRVYNKALTESEIKELYYGEPINTLTIRANMGGKIKIKGSPQHGYKFLGLECPEGSKLRKKFTWRSDNGDMDCVAIFIQKGKSTLTVNVVGSGTVRDKRKFGRINCPDDCEGTYRNATKVILKAKPADQFGHWTGDCQPITNQPHKAIAIIGRDKSCTAHFD